jgi:hypothetical protein
VNPRVLTLDTVDHRVIQVDEPDWCVGHGWQLYRGVYRNDITHYSVKAKCHVDTESQGRWPVLTAQVSWAPFAEPVPIVSIEMDVIGDFAAEDTFQVARGLRIAASRLERVASEAIRLRSGGTA